MDPLEELRSEVSLTMSKRQRGVISLVCRRWADTLRPWIFDSITLRSREDADALFSLSLRPHSDVLDYINVIEVSQSLTQYPYRPWIHTVYPAFDKLDSRIPAIHLTLCGPLPEGKFMKSICERLPASVPLYFTSITRLTLTNLHFRRVTDLVRIPRELPSLQFVHCRDITWNCPSSAEMPPASQYLSRMPVSDLDGITYALQGCTDNSVAGWFTALLAPRWRDRVQQSDAHIICHIASALARNIDSSKVPEWTMQATREEDHLGFIGRDENDPEMCLFPEFRAHLTQHVAAHARQVRAIWFHPLDVSATLEHSDWEAIGSVTATLPSLEALIIISASHADLLSFHNQILVPKMPSFHQSSKLKYVISSYDERRDEQRVRFVSCTEDKVHDAGLEDIRA
ncbi:hypothetical protein NM688_g123 [Phlebia brevispora]|uniref:Uncharacterized protein n=1 Tax=Phlebia brevispora TaxID=194682 RepID=A0ACC1TFZ4_9APHY|nr:hypothetical protein NM688_g123 [Phlebia brevispora]